MVSTILAYVATSLHLVNPTYILIPWVTPPVLSGYLATAGDIRAAILQLVIIAVGVFIYMPFVLISNKMEEK
jgi:PTS system cellobiose-specific IIC component